MDVSDARDRTTGSESRVRLLAGLPVVERLLDSGGISTPVLEGGEGPPVVLLHGIGSFSLEWSLVIPRLVPKARVIVPDLPGLGDSDARGRRLDAATLTGWLLELIERTCVEKPTLVGHSMGGSVAAHFAIRHGDRLRRIVLIDSSSLGSFRPAPGLIVALIRFGARPSPASRERFLRQVLADPEQARVSWGDRWTALEAYDLEQAGDKSVSRANGQLMRRIGTRRVPSDQLSMIGVPVSLIWGKKDRLMRYRIAEEASSRFGWPLYGFDDCGHGPQIERSDQLADALEATMSS